MVLVFLVESQKNRMTYKNASQRHNYEWFHNNNFICGESGGKFTM